MLFFVFINYFFYINYRYLECRGQPKITAAVLRNGISATSRKYGTKEEQRKVDKALAHSGPVTEKFCVPTDQEELQNQNAALQVTKASMVFDSFLKKNRYTLLMKKSNSNDSFEQFCHSNPSEGSLLKNTNKVGNLVKKHKFQYDIQKSPPKKSKTSVH